MIVIAAAASAAAGLVHAAAAGSHTELTTLATLFGMAAALQVAWAAALLWRRDVGIVLAGVGLQLVAVATWVASRTVGISFVDGLGRGQAIGFQDLLVVGLELIAAAAAALSLTQRAVVHRVTGAAPAFVVALLVAVVPAMASPHDHDSPGHVDGGEHELAAGTPVTDAGHPHDDEHVHDDSHDHGDGHHVAAPGATTTTAPPDEALPYPASFAGWLDTAETPEERAAAERLLEETAEAMEAFPDEDAVRAAGFVSIGDGATGWEHYINVDRIADPAVLDPSDIESIVLKVHPDGTKEVASAMYLLPFGATMDDAPDVAGSLTTWHDHQNLCWEGIRVVGTTDANGTCVRGEFRGTQPMMHVWVIEHECGPFAGIEGSHGSGCDHADH